MPKYTSPMSEPRPPKPRTQGDAKSSGPGSGSPKAAIRARNSQSKNVQSGVRTNSTKSPGSGTKGTGRTHNSVPRT